ncbi:MAG: hypothetical protein E6K80_03015 [Candidatus Eisenbacteria bacterium]|uniref:Uncharacterized protein n=1 Tax=Eiseniibacteriota bacterium TaxID=2212470 RepID=A0A538U8V0_UNCEI|nr:MAG: hypothetical protein E6K80_03015 [Candidatus Eisenbacteria bacterium]
MSILADAFESVVGGIYLDQGFEAARAFIERWLLRDTRSIVADKRHTNYKSHLQEYVQSTYRTHPVYRIRSEMGPDHSKQFMVEVIVGKRTLGDGKGRNKKEAEQAAARNALERVERGPISDRVRTRPDERDAEPTRAPRGERPQVTPVLEDEELGTGPEAEEGEEPGRRRRRGRRGGRGRRRSGDGREEAVERETQPTAEPPAESRIQRTTRPRVEPVSQPRPMEIEPRPTEIEPHPTEIEPRPMEIEPRPRRDDEDENEEVGRPEGPREPKVDPYAWGGADFRSAARSASFVTPTEEEETAEPENESERDEPHAEVERDISEQETTPSPGGDSDATPKAPVFGRRRSRR